MQQRRALLLIAAIVSQIDPRNLVRTNSCGSSAHTADTYAGRQSCLFGPLRTTAMDAATLSAQVNALVGQVICFRCFAKSNPTKSWSRYAGKLERKKAGDGSWKYSVSMGPEHNYLPLVVQQAAPSVVDMPDSTQEYTRIVASQVWVTEYAVNFKAVYDTLTQQVSTQQANASPAQAPTPPTLRGPDPSSRRYKQLAHH